MKRSLIFLLVVLLPFDLLAFTVTVYDLSEDDSYFNAKEVEENKGINLRWRSSVTDATYYINVDSPSKNSEHQVASGAYNGGEASYTIYANDILRYANNSLDGGKEIYILIEAQDSADGGSSSLKFQDNIKSLLVYIDRVPPPIPRVNSIVPGENSLRVYLNWGGDSDDSDKYGFNIYYKKSDSNDEPLVQKNVRSTDIKITGLINNVNYDIWAEQIDRAGNVSEKSEVARGTPREVLDYYEYYKSSGGNEKGGFCFIATAVYGSPAHPIVHIYKAFRDTYLERSPMGQEMISLYYRVSPVAADLIKGVPVLQMSVAFYLALLAFILYLTLKPTILILPVSLAIALYIVFKIRRVGVFLALMILVLFVPAPLVAESERSLGLSFAVGDFRPQNIDNENGLSAEPYKEIFDNKSEFMFKMGLDYEFLQGFGTLSAGGATGFWQVLGKGIYNYDNGVVEKSLDTTVFNIVPIEMNLIYKLDYYANLNNIPLVFYGKVGVDYYIFWITDSKGNVSNYRDREGGGSDGYGGKFGYHYAGGLMFLLDWIDRETAADFDMELGVNNSYLFVEMYKTVINGFGGSGLDLSNTGLFFGLYLDI